VISPCFYGKRLRLAKEFISKPSLLSFPLVGNPSSKKDCGQAAMTEIMIEWDIIYDPISNRDFLIYQQVVELYIKTKIKEQ
jgi:hypothetical protein